VLDRTPLLDEVAALAREHPRPRVLPLNHHQDISTLRRPAIDKLQQLKPAAAARDLTEQRALPQERLGLLTERSNPQAMSQA
jgi:hypothetical protein